MLTAATPKKAGIDRFRSDGCKCQLSGGDPCHTLFTATQIRAACDKCNQFTHDQLDMVVMGQLRSSCRNDRVTLKSKANNTVRQRSMTVPLWWPPYLPHFLPLSTCNGH